MCLNTPQGASQIMGLQLNINLTACACAGMGMCAGASQQLQHIKERTEETF
jgi:hypothetical protein